MPRPRRKSFWRWAPLPWVVLVLLMLATGSLHDARADAGYAVMLGVTIAAAIAAAIWLVVDVRRGGRNFTAEGRLARLDGLEFVDVSPVGHPITVHDTRRHRTAIDAALARARGELAAVIVTDVGNWWGLRSDVGVYLIAGDEIHLAGRLGDHAQVAWQAELDALRAAGRLVRVPVEVRNAAHPFALDVRLEGLRVLDKADA